jgi:hypothetical protein
MIKILLIINKETITSMKMKKFLIPDKPVFKRNDYLFHAHYGKKKISNDYFYHLITIYGPLLNGGLLKLYKNR